MKKKVTTQVPVSSLIYRISGGKGSHLSKMELGGVGFSIRQYSYSIFPYFHSMAEAYRVYDSGGVYFVNVTVHPVRAGFVEKDYPIIWKSNKSFWTWRNTKPKKRRSDGKCSKGEHGPTIQVPDGKSGTGGWLRQIALFTAEALPEPKPKKEKNKQD